MAFFPPVEIVCSLAHSHVYELKLDILKILSVVKIGQLHIQGWKEEEKHFMLLMGLWIKFVKGNSVSTFFRLRNSARSISSVPIEYMCKDIHKDVCEGPTN